MIFISLVNITVVFLPNILATAKVFSYIQFTELIHQNFLPMRQKHKFLNQARAWFLEITLMRTSVCVCMCLCVCVSAPQAIKY